MKPAHETGRERKSRQFFLPEFITQRLGKPGHWQGGATARLGLKDPVKVADFEKLRQGWTPDGLGRVRDPLTDSRLTGWRMIVRAEHSLSVLWALSPEPIRARIRLAHYRGAQVAVADFERTLNGSRLYDNLRDPDRKRTLFAVFHSGASPEQTPQLETTLFLFNFVMQFGGNLSTFTPEEMGQKEARIQAVYKRTVEREVTWVLGGRVQLPNELCQPFQRQTDFGPIQNEFRPREEPLQGEQLFAAWREQGRSWGWGPEKVKALLVPAKVQMNWRNVVQDCGNTLRLGSMWIHQRARAVEREVELPAKPQRIEQRAPAKNAGHQKANTIFHSY